MLRPGKAPPGPPPGPPPGAHSAQGGGQYYSGQGAYANPAGYSGGYANQAGYANPSGYGNQGGYGHQNGYQEQSKGGYGGGYSGYSKPATPDYDMFESGKYGNSSGAEGYYKDKPIKKKSSVLSFLFSLKLWFTIVFLVFGGLTFTFWSKYNEMLSILEVKSVDEARSSWSSMKKIDNTVNKQLATSRDKVAKLTAANTVLEREKRELEKERDELRVKYESPDGEIDSTEEPDSEQSLKEQMQALQKTVSRQSHQAALVKYGPGPHYVMMTVNMQGISGADPLQKIVLELAPLSLMPHAVHLFLEQVDQKLWDNAWFYINESNILLGGPLADPNALKSAGADADERALAISKFTESNLETLAFPEYAEEYPHLQWTVGFKGRPGGPEFYINKIDNSQAHGPGGKYQQACFARVVKGLDTLDVILKLPTEVREGDPQHFLKKPVHIIKTVVLKGAPTDIYLTKAPQSATEQASKLETQKQAMEQPQQLVETKGATNKVKQVQEPKYTGSHYSESEQFQPLTAKEPPLTAQEVKLPVTEQSEQTSNKAKSKRKPVIEHEV